MLLYITVGSFGSGAGGGEGGGEGFYIRLWCGGIVIPSLPTAAMLCGDQVLVCTTDRCENHGDPKPSSQIDE